MFVFLPPKLLLSISIIMVVHVQPRFAQDELSATHGRVIFSSVFFRHGDAAPSYQYLTRDASYWAAHWPQGKGNLSEYGKHQMQNLGIWFRQRYQSLIAQEVALGRNVGDSLSMDSSNMDRNTRSAKLFLHGLAYPNSGIAPDDVFNYQTPAEIKFDQMIDFYEVACPRYSTEMGQLNEDSYWIDFHSRYITAFNSMYGKLTANLPQTVVKAFEEAYSLYDTFVIEKSLNLELQPWANSIYPEPLKSIAVNHFYALVYNDIMKRLRSGPLIKEVVLDMELKIDAGSNVNSFHFYSGQDFTLSSLLLSLGVFDNNPPPPGSAILFELRQSQVGYYIVTVSYKNIDDWEPHLLRIPGCENGCTFQRFKELVHNLMPVKWLEECNS